MQKLSKNRRFKEDCLIAIFRKISFSLFLFVFGLHVVDITQLATRAEACFMCIISNVIQTCILTRFQNCEYVEEGKTEISCSTKKIIRKISLNLYFDEYRKCSSETKPRYQTILLDHFPA